MVTLSKIIDGLEMVDDIVDCYYNPEKDEVFLSNIGEYGDLTEDEIDELFEESIILPTQYEINEYKIIKDFIETIKDNQMKNQLLIVIQGTGAFRRFKDSCINYGIINDWYKFKNNAYYELAKEWCLWNNIDYEDDVIIKL